MKDERKQPIEDKVKKLQDSMDLAKARSKTWKDSRENTDNYPRIIENLDELEKAVKQLREEFKRGTK